MANILDNIKEEQKEIKKLLLLILGKGNIYLSAESCNEKLLAELKDHIDKKFQEMERKLSPMPEESGDAKWAAKYLDVSVDTIYRLTSSKTLKHHKPGKKLKIYRKDLDDYIQKKGINTSLEVGQEALKTFKSQRRRAKNTY